MIQQIVVDGAVAVAATWLLWTFAPFAVRRRIAALLPRGSRARMVAASAASAGGVEGLQAAEIDGRPAPAMSSGMAKDACGPDCGCR